MAVRYGGALDQLRALQPTAILCMPGGLAVTEGGRVVGALGVGGPDPAAAADIAAAALR